jgi:threonylcarbamoyladenosine tRNA methylthiotransferase MtaB
VTGLAEVVTHGCRSNLAEADALARRFGAGVTVVNSCAVTAAAVRDARAAARAALKRGTNVVLTGCAATAMPGRFADLGVRIVPNAAKFGGLGWGTTLRARAFVAVQDGCDHGCTFCVTRLARGRARSRPVADVVAEVTRLAAAGAAEVVLTGIDLSGYRDGGQRLGGLVQAILARVPGLRRLRLSSLDCAEVDDALAEAFSDARLMPQLHLSLQSGDLLVLKRMRRRHTPSDAVRLVARLKALRPDLAVGADLIAGFPTEGESAHRASLALIEACDIVSAHVFPFSPRPGTAAARMPQLPAGVASARAAELRAAAAQRRSRWLETLLGRPVEAVSEGEKGVAPQGHAVRFARPRPRGALAMVVPGAVAGQDLAE